jgi:hypothetical protein
MAARLCERGMGETKEQESASDQMSPVFLFPKRGGKA